MRYEAIDLKNIYNQKIGFIVDFLNRGKVIVYPTDTIYGLGCLADNVKAIKKIQRLKKRDKNKGMIVLISDFQMLKKYFKVSKKQEEYLKTIWPGKVSVILNKKELLGNELSGGSSSIAVRLPKSKFLTKMIEEAGVPIVSTSLNLSGEKPLETVDGLEEYFSKTLPDLVIDAGKIGGKPSRLIDLRDINNVIILRK